MSILPEEVKALIKDIDIGYPYPMDRIGIGFELSESISELELRSESELESESLAAKPREKSSFNPNGKEIIKAFEDVDPKNKTYYGNKTQRAACDFLIAEYTIEEVLRRISLLRKTNELPYFPKIHSPHDLKEKWVLLEDKLKEKKFELSNKNQPNYVL